MLGKFLILVIAILVGLFPKAFVISPLWDKDVCPTADYAQNLDHEHTQYILHDNSFSSRVIERFAGALRIDTTIEDDPSPEDFEKFTLFHDYLKEQFPLAWKNAEVTIINDYSLVFEFIGSDKSLKPPLFMAHQDTVPFGDLKSWEYDPLSGKIDLEAGRVYGRGANDVKNLLVGLLGAVEEIFTVHGDIQFKRGFILGFGHDEEISGYFGAEHIGEYLLNKYGPKGIDHIMDEGPPMFLDFGGRKVGLVVTAEKGYLDLHIEVNTPGGHSSNPRDVTSIGILSDFLNSYEQEQFEPILTEDNPLMCTLECVGQYGELPKTLTWITRLIRKNSLVNYLLRKFLVRKSLVKYTIQTAQAVDIIRGGDKINALPRSAEAFINHRIAIGNDKFTVLEKAKKHALKVAKKEKIGLIIDEEIILPETGKGVMNIEIFGMARETAPLTPLYDDKWNRLAGYMRSFYELEVYPQKFEDNDDNYIVTPTSMQGNTDSVHYWKVTDHIYRVQPGITNLFEANMHGNNEWVHIDTHLQVIGFYYNYILGICL